MSGCTVLGCGRRAVAEGMCRGHHGRAVKGLPVFVYLDGRPGSDVTAAVRFGPPRPTQRQLRQVTEAAYRAALRENVTTEPNTGCFLWLGALFPTNYGNLGKSSDPWGGYAHRAALYFQGVELERNNRFRHVRHLCDQPACVNPSHLVYGTAKENVEDRERHGRGTKGRRFGDRVQGAKLTAKQAAVIKARLARGEVARTIAPDFGVSVPTIYSIKGGYIWRDVAPAMEAA